jgi:hypothetical protein
MTFLFELVVEFLGRTAAWLAAELLVAGVGLAVVILVLRAAGRDLPLSTGIWVAATGAILGASLAHRFDLPMALEFVVWRRSVPVVWSLAAATAAAAVWGLVATRGDREATRTE